MHNLWQKRRDVCLVSHALCSRGSGEAAHHFVSQLLFVFAFLHGPLHAVPPQIPFKLFSAGFLTLQVAIIIITIIILLYFSASGRYRATKCVWLPALSALTAMMRAPLSWPASLTLILLFVLMGVSTGNPPLEGQLISLLPLEINPCTNCFCLA